MVRDTFSFYILKRIYVNSLLDIPSTLLTLSDQFHLSSSFLSSNLNSLLSDGYMTFDSSSSSYFITPKGRSIFSVVLLGGVFDIVHIGHIYTFEQARSLGDILVVIIATDITVKSWKNRFPVNSQSERVKVVNHIKDIDCALIGHEEDFFVSIDFVKPDIIALGYDQKFDEDKLKQQLVSHCFDNISIVRLKEYIPNKSTTKIFREILRNEDY